MTLVTKEVERLSLCSKTAHVALKCPWPVWNRDMFLSGFGVDLLEDGMVAVSLRSCRSGDVILGKRIKPLDENTLPKTVRMEVNTSGFLFEPLTPDSTRVTIMLNQDPKIDFLPTGVLNYFTKNLAWVALTLFRKAAMNLSKDEDYLAAIRNDPDLYSLIRRRQADFFESEEYKQRASNRVDVYTTNPNSSSEDEDGPDLDD